MCGIQTKTLTDNNGMGILIVSARVGPIRQVLAKFRQVREEAAVGKTTWVISINRLGSSFYYPGCGDIPGVFNGLTGTAHGCLRVWNPSSACCA